MWHKAEFLTHNHVLNASFCCWLYVSVSATKNMTSRRRRTMSAWRWLVKLIFKYSRWVSWLSANSIRQKPDKFWFVPPQKCWNVSADTLLNLQGQVFCQCKNFTDDIYNIQGFGPLFASSLGFNLCYWHYKIYLGDCGTQLQLFILRKYFQMPLSLRIILKSWKTSDCCSEMPVSAKMTEKWLVKPSQGSETCSTHQGFQCLLMLFSDHEEDRTVVA